MNYDNMPMQYTVIFLGCKNGNFQMKNRYFSYLCSKHRLQVSVRTASLRPIVFSSKNKKIMCTPENPNVTI